MAELSTLPRAWIERIFLRLQGVYGSQFTAKYTSGQHINGRDSGYENAMAVWGEELAGFSENSEAIVYALQNLEAKFPPNVREFAELCRRAPRPELPALPAPEPDKQKIEAAALEAKRVTAGKNDLLRWAKRPRSQFALDAVIDLAKRDRVFAGFLEELREAGRVEGEKLVQRWDGQQWLRA